MLKNSAKKDYVMNELSQHLFWDVPKAKIDLDKNAQFMIQRVFEYGLYDDIFWLIAYFGKTKCSNTLKKAEFLKQNAFSFASNYFNIPKTDFKCYSNKQFQQLYLQS